MVKYIQIGNGKSAMHVQNNYVNHMLHVGFIDNYNYINKVFPYGPVSSDFRYDVGMRFNRIVAAVNKVCKLPWVIGPIINLKWVVPRKFISDVELMYPHTLGLPYKASVADLNAHLIDMASGSGMSKKHVIDLERHYVR